MNDWKIEGLKELGMTTKEYLKLSSKKKREIDECLEEFGH